jgi:hypothetical protein
MFGTNTQLKVKQLESDLVDRDQRIELLQEQLAALRSEQAKAVADSSFAVDFNRMGAYSIERIIQNGRPVTVVGHWTGPNDENAGEWFFHCNQDTHERLVDEFRQYQGG